MKRLFLLALLTIVVSLASVAKNTKQTLAKVTEAMSLTADVDLHITGTTPFSEGASIDIVNTDHAVVIFDALRPSKAKAFLKFITINGEAAQDSKNCQLKLYDRGAILLPYGGTTFRPLTVFDQPNFEGESESKAFTEGHSGGFMKTVPVAWNNRIQSFRLKRGYMVTFALKKAGYGYSRCFIANDADLEVNLPTLMAGRISSYRIFKWYDTSKVGVADWLDAGPLATLNAQTSFTWGPGKSMLPDVEVVPHRIDESWPTPAECGQATYSPHLKTNNEPRNEADHGTWTMEQILANWQDLMRTGMRLCTPSSWDGSDYWTATGFLADFLNEIDARGWRCDIIDLHGYWNEGSFTQNVNNWAQKFKRPVWITEWVWGSSWGNNGIFGEASSRDNPTAADLQLNKTVVARILDNLNGNNACERYFYWNGEANCSKIMRNGQLTPAGEYFATMKTNGPGYTGYGNYIPKAPPMQAISDLTATFTAKNMTCLLEWTNKNGDLSTTISLQRRIGSEAWETIQQWTGAEIEDKTSMSYKDVIDRPGSYTYRIVEISYNNASVTSNLAYNNIASAEGTEDLQYGSVSALVGDENYVYFGYPFDEASEPIVVFGSPTYKNSTVGIVDNLMAVNEVGKSFTYFRHRFNKWASDEATATTKKDETSFIAAAPAHGKVGKLAYEAAYFDNSTTDVEDDYVGFEPTEIRFKEPFATVPIVMVQPVKSSATASPIMWRVWDVTTEGFKVQLMLESNITKGKVPCRLGYFAIEKGQGTDGVATLYTVGDTTLTFKTAQQSIIYPRELDEPHLMAQLQSFDYDAAAILRIGTPSTPSVNGAVRMQVDKSNTSMVLSSSRSATEKVGYIVISKASEEDIERDKEEPDAVRDVRTASTPSDVYDISGRRTDILQRGVYIINGRKLLVK